MSAVEDRLRSGLRSMADEVQPAGLRSLRAPAPRWGRAGHRWAAALVAIAAVAALAVGVNIAAHHRHQGALTPMPHYYVYSGAQGGTVLTIRSSATGAVLDTLLAPAGLAWGRALAAAASDRTFLVSVTGGRPGQVRLSYRLLRLTAAGQVASVTTVPVSFPAGPHRNATMSLALEPGGKQFAAVIEPSVDPLSAAADGKLTGTTRLVIVSVATGRVLQSWTAPAYISVSALSWAVGQLTLTSTNYRRVSHVIITGELRRVNLATPGGSLLKDSAAVRLRIPSGGSISQAQLTPDGRRVIAWIQSDTTLPYGGGDYSANVLAEYSARTGRRIRVLSGNPISRTLYVRVWPVAMDASGQHLLIQAENVYSRIITGRLDGERFTPLPHPGVSAVTASLVGLSW